MHVRLLFKIMTLSVAFGFAACGSSPSDSSSGGSGGTGVTGGAAGGAGGTGVTGGAAGGAGGTGVTGGAAGGAGGTGVTGGAAGGAGGTGVTGGAAGGAGGSTTSTPAAEGPSGLFEVHYMSASSIADISGIMWNRPPAELVMWGKVKTDGACSLYRPESPYCESCSDGQVCVAKDVCRAQSVKRSVGNVTLTGLNSKASPLPLMPVPEAAPVYSSPESLSLPPCTVGGTVQLDAAGAGEYPAFSVQAKCIDPLVVASRSVPLESGKAFKLTWTPGTVADARVTLEFDLSHHGGSKGQIRCDTADTGSLEVSASLVKSLVDLGVTGFPWLTVERVVKGTTPVGSGQAQLKVYSDEKINLEVPGVVSCNQDSECPTGQTCLNTSNMCGIACTSNANCPTGQTCQASTKSCK